MFSFYRLIEVLDEQLGGDVASVGIPSGSGTSAAGAINPPESPAVSKHKRKEILPPVKPEEPKKEPEVKSAEKNLEGPR